MLFVNSDRLLPSDTSSGRPDVRAKATDPAMQVICAGQIHWRMEIIA
jgi:hypothetical protein